jgi:hypothetical protein
MGAAASPMGVSNDLLDVGIIAPHAGKSQKGLFARSYGRRALPILQSCLEKAPFASDLTAW